MLERRTIAEVARASAFGDWSGTDIEGLALRERRGFTVIELAAFGRGEAARAALSQALGLMLPGAGACAKAVGVAALSIGPGRWLLMGSEAAIADLPTPAEDAAAITDLSDGRAILTLSGAKAVRTLMKGTAVDLDRAVFADGGVAATALAHMPVVIWRRGAAYDVIVARSYAVSLLDWLVIAGA